MRKAIVVLVVVAAAFPMARAVDAETLFLRGKVRQEDGSPPGKAVSILRVCAGRDPKNVAIAGKSGEYIWRTEGDFLGLDIYSFANSQTSVLQSADSSGATFAKPIGAQAGAFCVPIWRDTTPRISI
jgi:hypothetical protein